MRYLWRIILLTLSFMMIIFFGYGIITQGQDMSLRTGVMFTFIVSVNVATAIFNILVMFRDLLEGL